MKIKNIILLISLTFLTFANSLGHDFIGDSKSLFLHNSFYKHPEHLKYLFSKDLIMAPEQNRPPEEKEHFYSGLISYRPVTALTFFTDYSLYRERPAGFHFTNILLHVMTVCLVFALARYILGNNPTAFMAALLFGVHPVQSELVSCIGYRSDLLATFFILIALLTYIASVSQTKRKKKTGYVFSLTAFFLALFSKETALAFFPLLILTDMFFIKADGKGWAEHFKSRSGLYSGYILILLFYLFIYFSVCAGEHYPKYFFLQTTPVQHGRVVLVILFEYLKVFFFPWTVTVLPPLFAPEAGAGQTPTVLLSFAVILVSLVSAYIRRARNPVIAFSVFWFFISYLPASNIVWLPNPIAFRFMYLPAVGMVLILATGIEKMAAALQKRFPSCQVSGLVKAAVVGICMSASFANNSFFKNDFSACLEMVRNYPDSSRPYWILGLNCYEQARFAEAKNYFMQYYHKDPRNPFVPDVKTSYVFWHSLGRCYVDDPEKAIELFKKALSLKPDFFLGYLDLAKAYLLQEDYARAVPVSLAAIRLNRRAALPYVYAIHSYVELGDWTSAEKLLQKAESFAGENVNVRYVAQLLKQRRENP